MIEVNGLKLKVKALDAIDGTPVLDIKPYVREFEPDPARVLQPQWMTELMRDYFLLMPGLAISLIRSAEPSSGLRLSLTRPMSNELNFLRTRDQHGTSPAETFNPRHGAVHHARQLCSKSGLRSPLPAASPCRPKTT